MGGRGASSGISKGGAITEGERDIKIKAAGGVIPKFAAKLPRQYQY